jgi:hypothetical protein
MKLWVTSWKSEIRANLEELNNQRVLKTEVNSGEGSDLSMREIILDF